MGVGPPAQNHSETGALAAPVSTETQVATKPRIPTAVWIGGIVLLGAFLRLWNIDAVGFNGDETVYAGQAASIANVHDIAMFFPTFRAHPLLFQSILATGYDLGLKGDFQRPLAALFGVGTVVLTYLLGHRLYGRRAGLIAALIMAVMPYDVIVSRQVLLDGPMTFFATLSLYLLARFATTRTTPWLLATGAALGLSVLSKETAILLFGSICAFVALSPELHIRVRQLALLLAALGVIVIAYPIAIGIGGSGNTSGNYLTWQLFRRANHELTFYPSILPGAMGPLVLVTAGVAVFALRRSWREKMLLSWILVPAVFFELWPVKGYQYLLPAAPAVAALAGRAIGALMEFRTTRLDVRHRRMIVAAGVAALAASLLVPTLDRVSVDSSAKASSLAGTGGVPRGREAGLWIDRHVPQGATIMTIGPSMANIIEFYGKRQAYGLAVSPNPLSRNPSYQPIPNPDRRLRNADLQYLVWDAYSASRSAFFSKGIIRYADRYNGHVVHTEYVKSNEGGRTVKTPVIVVYTVRP
ncbi:MAG TPA: glycosyltransferase family 39 protein [Thermoleophilaceae bacterium]|nr:glycosyltransferase family 39 protein [Thermoleophilaceae bacterium]